MKAFLILAPLAAALAGCAYYTSPPVAVVPAYTAPSTNAVVVAAPPVTYVPSR